MGRATPVTSLWLVEDGLPIVSSCSVSSSLYVKISVTLDQRSPMVPQFTFIDSLKPLPLNVLRAWSECRVKTSADECIGEQHSL